MKSLNYVMGQLDDRLNDMFGEKVDWKEKSIIHERLKTARGKVPGTIDIIDTEDDNKGTPSNNKHNLDDFAKFLSDNKITVGGKAVTAQVLAANAIKMLAKPDGSNAEAIKNQINNLTISSAVINDIQMEIKNGDIPAEVFRKIILTSLKNTPAPQSQTPDFEEPPQTRLPGIAGAQKSQSVPGKYFAR